jgi:hypothetical protein
LRRALEELLRLVVVAAVGRGARLQQVEPRILAGRRRQRAHAPDRAERRLGLTGRELGAAQVQPVVEAVGEEREQRLVRGEGLVPLLLALAVARLDEVAVLARQVGGELEGAARLGLGLLVVAERGEHVGHGQVPERVVRLLGDDLLDGAARADRVEVAQAVAPLGVAHRDLLAGRPGGPQRRGLGRRQAGDAELLPQLAAGACHQLQELARAAHDVRARQHRGALRVLHHEVNQQPAARAGLELVGAADDQVGSELVADAAEQLARVGRGRRQLEVDLHARDAVGWDAAEVLADGQLGAEQLEERRREPGVRSAAAILQADDGDRAPVLQHGRGPALLEPQLVEVAQRQQRRQHQQHRDAQRQPPAPPQRPAQHRPRRRGRDLGGERLQRLRQLLARGVALQRIAAQAAIDDRGEAQVHGQGLGGERPHVLVDRGQRQRLQRLLVVRRVAAAQLVEDRAQAVHVGALGRGLAAPGLGRHVRRRAEDGADHGQRAARPGRRGAGDGRQGGRAIETGRAAELQRRGGRAARTRQGRGASRIARRLRRVRRGVRRQRPQRRRGQRRQAGLRRHHQPAAEVIAQLGQPEVEQLGGALLGEHDIGGLEVAVEHALPVRGAEAAGELQRDVEDLLPGQRQLELVQALPAHELRGQVRPPPGPADAVDRQDVGVVQPGDGAGLDEEALARGLVRADRGQELHRHRAPEQGVARLEDLAHGAATERPDDLVLVDLARDLGSHLGRHLRRRAARRRAMARLGQSRSIPRSAGPSGAPASL